MIPEAKTYIRHMGFFTDQDYNMPTVHLNTV